MRAGELDIGLLRERPVDPDLDAMPVVAERLGVLLAASVAAELADDEECVWRPCEARSE
ncbi:hypothetical protein [Streptomyces pseudogriseolus]|uniref:hypothetical protein n=1 Tax=Streptomyces pseudogriseolus TaxID=36817 RepID=UPI003FA33A25